MSLFKQKPAESVPLQPLFESMNFISMFSFGRIKDSLRKKYADAANAFAAELTSVSKAIASLDGDLEVGS